jgi:NAD(P)-dependent dehydrogenase (short-subunit alcohol dehydrogenase family)
MNDSPSSAAVFGTGGGIGAALVAALREGGGFAQVHAFRRPDVDVTDEAGIARAAQAIAAGPQLRLAIVATGILAPEGRGPEKNVRQIDGDALAKVLRVNTIGPALVAKHVLPLLPRDGRAVFAALSARVGSIGDNRLGGWHAYRASKAALNMLVCGFAIELAQRAPEAICVSLHPGTVDTALSRPFQRGMPPEKLFTPEYSAARLLEVIAGLTPDDSGGCFDWAGERIVP